MCSCHIVVHEGKEGHSLRWDFLMYLNVAESILLHYILVITVGSQQQWHKKIEPANSSDFLPKRPSGLPTSYSNSLRRPSYIVH